ncbi:MAG: methyl-accepting chemotaxis protein [Deltaproteobacteria bacterium]|nr:methyl-accepting chemotaxis protein [Deltaproteobacteria bacterium]
MRRYMASEPLKESFAHTLKTFWTGKRFLKLFIFALLLGNITYYCVWMLARRQVVTNAANHHSKVYNAYVQAVERARKSPVPEAQGAPGVPAGEAVAPDGATSALSAISPYWGGLREVRKQFPHLRVAVVLQGTVDGDRDRKVLDVLRTRARDWVYNDTQDGWARSFYSLPTKDASAFQVVSDIRDDLAGWETTAGVMGGYAFILLFAFGWFWTRALDEAGQAVPVIKFLNQASQATGEVAVVLAELQREMAAIEASDAAGGLNPDVIKAIDDMTSQIRLLAVNGSIEAARSADAYRVFHVLMQEINQLATQCRAQLKNVDAGKGSYSGVRRKLDQLQARVSGDEEVGQPRSAAGTAFRRVG